MFGSKSWLFHSEGCKIDFFVPLLQVCITDISACHDPECSQKLLHCEMQEAVSVDDNAVTTSDLHLTGRIINMSVYGLKL